MCSLIHTPALLKEVIEILKPGAGEIWVDCTVGTGGHSLAILEAMEHQGTLIGIDLDPEALAIASGRLSGKGDVRLWQSNFRHLDLILESAKISRVDGVFLDLGVSALQLYKPERGFSFIRDGNLDMRFDPTDADIPTAEQLINQLSAKQLSQIFRCYGEELYATRIAKYIVKYRQQRRHPIKTTTELAELIKSALPSHKRYRPRIHPATRCFQSLRMYINSEICSLAEVLDKAVAKLNVGGRLGVIAYESLSDRIVKQKLTSFKQRQKLELLTKRAVVPSTYEISINPSARSARFRAAIVIR